MPRADPEDQQSREAVDPLTKQSRRCVTPPTPARHATTFNLPSHIPVPYLYLI